ncbi:amidohydrolase-domain-containing protein [Auriculariales sp. MPI-PUGE-AT-0066]|nr:amidohydrolase-domain-containing protein [Auriculariales sp. MPI-PUGE-AT-0066]
MSQTYERLMHTALRYPIIDNHCHNLLKATSRDHFTLERLTSENDGSPGDGLPHASFTLAHMRAVRQLAKLYECDPNWAAVKQARASLEYDELCRRCFADQNIYGLLIDTGLATVPNHCEPVEWHAKWTTGGVSKTIIRVEAVAEGILNDMMSRCEERPPVMDDFLERFKSLLSSLAQDEGVVGFKSIICYRTGLEIALNPERTNTVDQSIMSSLFNNYRKAGAVRICHRLLNDTIAHLTLSIAAHFNFTQALAIRDLRIHKANPSLLQPVIDKYKDTQIVLLHASYPYTREAGYLASVYGNVYVDIGEIWPYASADAQRTAIRHAMDLCPTNKILFSTDAHHWPDGYFLAVQQGRAAFHEVFSDYVRRSDLTEDEAILIVRGIYFHNTNRLYKLGLAEPLAN